MDDQNLRQLPTPEELSKRATFLGVLAWMSVSLMATCLFPEVARNLKVLWMTSGMIGLISTVGLFEVIKQDIRRQSDIVNRYVTESRTDALTGIANRRQFDARLEEAFNERTRTETPLSVILIDIDFFKNVNDTFGHQAGDDVLRSTGQILQSSVREDDLVARYGGEEFVVITPDVCPDIVRLQSERIREAIQQHEFSFGTATTNITISIGLAFRGPDDTPESLLQRADTALYQAKAAGRNCTFYWEGDTCLPVATPEPTLSVYPPSACG